MTGRNEHGQQIDVAIKTKIQNYPKQYYLDRFMDYLIATDKSPTTRREYVNKVIKFLDIIGKPVNEITGLDIMTYIGGLNNNTSSYRRQIFYALQRYFKCLVGCRVISKEDNPMIEDIIENPKNKENPNPRQKDVLTVREMNIIRQRVRNGYGNDLAQMRQVNWRERDIAIMDLFLSTGMRCSALSEIDIDDFDDENETITVVNKGDKIMVFELAPSVADSIRDWLRVREYLTRYMLYGTEKETNAMFISYRMSRLSPQGVANLIKKYADNIDGKNITPHRLRATFATMLYKETKDLLLVSRAMGHASPQTTQKHYVKSEENPTRSAGARIANKWN